LKEHFTDRAQDILDALYDDGLFYGKVRDEISEQCSDIGVRAEIIF
jgi:hypothetical protein